MENISIYSIYFSLRLFGFTKHVELCSSKLAETNRMPEDISK